MKVEETEIKVALLLRWGAVLAGVLMLLGWILSLYKAEISFIQFQVHETQPLQSAFALAWQSRNLGLIFEYLGLFVLISLPAIRVGFVGLSLLQTREWILAVVSGLVLVGLFISFLLGLTSG